MAAARTTRALVSGPDLPPGPSPPIALGVIVPHDMALDHELWRWTPEGVALLFTRTPHSPLPVTVEMAMQVGDTAVVQQRVKDLMAVAPTAYVYACTAGSFVHGTEGERALVQAMIQAGAPTALTTSGALVQALRQLGAGRVAMATPYQPEITERLRRYLEECGIEVVASSDLGLVSGIWRVPYTTTAELIIDADDGDADAVLVSCTNLPTYDVIAPLEARLGKPIVTANQATMWAVLGLVGQAAEGAGQRLIACTTA